MEKRREEFREYYRDYGFEGEALEAKIDKIIDRITGRIGQPGTMATHNQFDNTKKFWKISKLFFNEWRREMLKYPPEDFDREAFNKQVAEYQDYYDLAMKDYKKAKLQRWRKAHPEKYRAIQRKATSKYRHVKR